MVTDINSPQLFQRRRRALCYLGSVVAVAALIYGIYWWLNARHYQETNDAYVVGDQIPITAQINGKVQLVAADTTDVVQAGDLLVQLDPVDAEQILERAKLALAQCVRQTHSRLLERQQLAAKVVQQRLVLQQAEGDLQRRTLLGRRGAIGQEAVQHTRETVQQAQISLKIATEALRASQALLLDTPLAEQPGVLEAAIQLQQAWLTLQRTRIVTPVTGQVVRRSVQLGTQIAAGTPLMMVVPLERRWIEANFKETQLKAMRIGQPVGVTSDLYGIQVNYAGVVTGLYASTGSSLSLLPPQNATGNWIKVVQRIPVKIALDRQQLKRYPLRIGLSTTVKVHTQQTTEVTPTEVQEPVSCSQAIPPIDLTPVKQLIIEIITSNVA
ncbi:HlyD family secretion protein [unidentified bacterial endosymbiont]|uniref:HlyD family secretion protein n=1 Tax=unidentified bacterial endosymbiont TaxID=2355 RepID=UPI00209CB516|nr:HlyD family efflux transporter periplasmic adaptor subunit [unidentified bacterial endosymbiont]